MTQRLFAAQANLPSIGQGEPPNELHRLAREMTRLSQRLRRALGGQEETGLLLTEVLPGDASQAILPGIRRYLRARALRSHFLAPGMNDCAWDMLLDLYLCKHSGRLVSVSDACLASGAPPTTALRWLQRLEEGGLISRLPDLGDGRRVYLELAPEAERAVACWAANALGTHQPDKSGPD